MAAEKELLDGISLMKQGKEEGFNILYSYTYNFVYARARAATKNETDAQDLTQETFIQAYKGIASLEDANNVYAWLGGIVFRQGAKLYNKTKKELLLNEDQDYIFDEVETKDVDALPEASAELKATSDVVMSMIEELPELQRSAIVSFYYDHMKIEEIAKIFDCSVNTIKSRLNYAKKFLKSKVEEHQKQYSYKLFSFSPVILLYALRELLSSEEYTMASEAAERVYHVACETLGITASSIALGATAAAASSSVATGATGVATGAGATGAAVSAGATGAAGTATATTAKGAGLLGKFMALSTIKKTGAVLLATTLVGGGATTAVLLTNDNPKPPAIVVETEQEVPEITATPVITKTPSVTKAPSASLDLPRGNYVYTEEEYYSYLAQQAKAGVEKTLVYYYNGTNRFLDNVPKLQQYAGINVSINAVKLDVVGVKYTCIHGHTHNAPFRPVEVTFTYGESEIAAYSEEDYWDKVEKAVAKRLDSFTIYMTKKNDKVLHDVTSKYTNHEYPADDFLSGAVCYCVEMNTKNGSPQYKQSLFTYHFTYLDSNDIRINDEADIHSTISAWYEGTKEPGVTFYVPVAGDPNYIIDESFALQDWFYTQYPDTEYHMEFEYFTSSGGVGPLYYTCTIKRDGDPEIAPEVLPPVDESISLAPIATPHPTPTPVPEIVLTDEETLSYANQILAEIITTNMSELEKVKAIHDYMIMNLDPDEFAACFDMVPTEDTTVNRSLGTGYTSCAGYAATFQYLCNLAGLESTCCTGDVYSHCWGHTWNQVKVDGNWYNIDVCADENMDSLTKDFHDHSNATYGYFLVSDNDLGYTTNEDAPPSHPCTAESIAYRALEYGCPWGFLVYCSSEEELRQHAQQASADGLTHMRFYLQIEWDADYTDVFLPIYEGFSRNYYSTNVTSHTHPERSIGGLSYVSFDLEFESEDGLPVTYPYADTVEKVHEVVNQAVSERKREISLYAPSLDFVKSALKSYPVPEGYIAYNPITATNHSYGLLPNIDTLVLIRLRPINQFSFPNL